MSISQPFRFFFMVSAWCIVAGCGSTTAPSLSITYSGQDAFGNAQVSDVVYTAQSKTSNGVGLDANGDGIADQFVYPDTCGGAKPAGCGFSVNDSGTVELGALPLDFLYDFRVEFRDASGAVLFCGETSFQNQESTQTLQVPIQTGDCS
jgi:hypothetical protein